MVNNQRYSLSRKERLRLKRHTDLLFAKGKSFVAFPLRVIYLPIEEPAPASAPVAVMVCVPKKKIKRAVGRNYIKRQMREAYRMNKHELIDALVETNKALLLAFLYVDKVIHPSSDMEKAMTKALKTLRSKAW
ncbi:MAG: ribonuclease P protein component [Tannerellaceae bacterium]|jgi:ribonuclease P protein component|nr:ribonuclease P protein component [Tannerellaceae bacterium]